MYTGECNSNKFTLIDYNNKLNVDCYFCKDAFYQMSLIKFLQGANLNFLTENNFEKHQT